MAALSVSFRSSIIKVASHRKIQFAQFAAKRIAVNVKPPRFQWYSKKRYIKKKLPTEVPPEKADYSFKTVKGTDAIAEKGFVRPQKPYNPPFDVEAKIKNMSNSLSSVTSESDWRHLSLDNAVFKYKLLTECSKEFSHDVPNSCLHRMKTVGDVLDFYLIPVEGAFSYDQMVQQQSKLPPNLHVIPTALRFHPDTDTLFDGITAFPKSSTIVSSLKWKKKYPGYDADFKWPDI